ncbi:ParA family partition ATPase [Agromyces bauzanensis]
MEIIAVLNQKGGAGKTTIATHLSRALQSLGSDVVLVDSDPQGSARDWAAVDENNPIVTVGIDRPTIARDARKLGARYVVIDGAPQAQELAASALTAADLVLIPVQPSPYDIWATADLVELVKQRQMITDGKLRAYFVVSRAINGTTLGKEIREALEDYGLPVLETVVHQRQAYPKSAVRGSTVLDDGTDAAAAAEIRALAAEVVAILEGAKEGVDA